MMASGSRAFHGARPGAPASQDFQQEMLRKLALHLAAQPEEAAEASSDLARERSASPYKHISTPESPGTPAFVEPTVHQASSISTALRWADESDDEAVCCADLLQRARMPQSRSEAPGEFQQEMLQRLALHLASQPDGDVERQSYTPFSRPCAPVPHLVACVPAMHPPAPRACGRAQAQRPLEQDAEQQELLRRLALHLAAQPDGSELGPEVGEDKARCEEIERLLQSSDAQRDEAMRWVLAHAVALSLQGGGCRVVQRAIELADASERESLAASLLPEARQLCESPHANHVLAKLIEVLPVTRLTPLLDAFQGQVQTLARHRFGSRILERLTEHCSEAQLGPLLDEAIEDIEALARHQHGNFFVQRLLEHGSASRKRICAEKLLPFVLEHAVHRTASNTLQRLIDHASLDMQAAIADKFLAGEGVQSLEAIAVTRYGSFVVQLLVDRLHPRIDVVKTRIRAAKSQLQASGFSRRKIVEFLGEAFFQ